MSNHVQLYNEDIRPINKIEFNVLGNKEIARMSVVGVEVTEHYENMEPKRSGVIDTRLGVSGNQVCNQCGLDSTHCVGHFGHIEFGEAVFHVGYLKFVKKILSCICLKCSKLLVYKNEEQLLETIKTKSSKTRFSEITNLVKNVTHCIKPNYGCGTPVTKIKIETKKQACSINIISELTTTSTGPDGAPIKKIIRQTLTPEICYDILKNISDSDCRIMGLDPEKFRPEDMIHKIFPVSPVPVRPSVRADFMESTSKEDDLTAKLIEIVRANIRLRKSKESTNENSTKYNIDHVHLLQFQVCTNFDNETSIMPKSELRNKPTQSFSSRLKGKEGRIRGNLMGKRVDFCARTVITGDPTIDIDELRVPKRIAMNLTFPEVVTPANKARLTKLIRNGKDKYPGANYVFPFHPDSNKIQRISLQFGKDKVTLKYGDIVERHLVDGDIVLLNRQPSLHKISMMAHRIKVIQQSNIDTFGLNESVTTPYNADFDGDEMNIFVPQSVQAVLELAEIANVSKQIIAARSSLPVIGLVQDSILGAYNLTKPNVTIDWRSAMNIISYTSFDRFHEMKKNKKYTGQELFSLIIPSKINMDGKIKIRGGQLESGQLDGSHLGKGKPNSLVHNVWQIYGSEQTRVFLGDAQKLSNNYNLITGFSVGISDTIIPKRISDEINISIQTKILEVDHMITEMENNPDVIDPEVLEETILGELSTIGSNGAKLVMKVMETESIPNNFRTQIVSQAKGSELNMGQIAACVGQQKLEGKRLKKKFHGRTMAYFHQNDDSALARGFVVNPFIKGIAPKEYIAHVMTSREGLLDTAIKTADTGYVQRQLIKLLEDLSIKYDGTVRNAKETIIQFIYGGSGCDTTRQYMDNLNFLEMNNEQIAKKILFTKEELNSLGKSYTDNMNQKHYNSVLRMRNKIRKYRMETSPDNITFDSRFLLGVNLKLIIDTSQYDEVKSKTTLLVEPKYVEDMLEKILSYDSTQNTCMTKESHDRKSVKYWDEMRSKLIFRFALYQYLSPKICTNDYKLTKERFDHICSRIMEIYNKAIVDPGEMVGIVAAQSLGEPTTQMSCLKSTKIIIVYDDKSVWRGPIGTFIDRLMKGVPDKVITFGKASKLSSILDLPQQSCWIVGVSNDEQVSWNSISQISCHPANGQLVRIQTASGRSTTATLSHSFLKRGLLGIETIRGSDLKLGDFVPVAQSISLFGDGLKILQISSDNEEEESQDQYELTYDFGYVIGAYLGKGTSISIDSVRIRVTGSLRDKIFKWVEKEDVQCGENDDSMEIVSEKLVKFIRNQTTSVQTRFRQLPSCIFTANSEFTQGVITGLFESKKYNFSLKKGVSISVESEELANDLLIILSYFNVFSTKSQHCTEQYTVTIPSTYYENLNRVMTLNGFTPDTNNSTIYSIPNRDDIIPSINETLQQAFSLCTLSNELKKNTYSDLIRNGPITRYRLNKYIELIRENEPPDSTDQICRNQLNTIVEQLEKARDSHVVWDRIVKLEYIDDPEELVYDFTVPGNNTFMVDEGILVHNTLNSIDWKEQIIINDGGRIEAIPIGQYIDQKISKEKNVITASSQSDEMDDITYVDTSQEQISTLSVNSEGKVSWNKVLALTKHLPINRDGTTDLVKIVTESGREVTATKAKSFLVTDPINTEIVPIRGDEIQVGHHVPVLFKQPINNTNLSKYVNLTELNFSSGGQKGFGYIIGLLTSQGLVNTPEYVEFSIPSAHILEAITELGLKYFTVTGDKDTVKIMSMSLSNWICGLSSPDVSELLLTASESFARGFLEGYSTVFTNEEDPNIKIKYLVSTDRNLIDCIGIMLTQIPFKSKKAIVDQFKSIGTLYILEVLLDGFESQMNGVWADPIIKVEHVKPTTSHVYDLTVDNDKTFLTLDGIMMEDTFHTAGTGSAGIMGVPRVKELLHLAKAIKTPNMRIYFLKEYSNQLKVVNKIQSNLKYITLQDIRNALNVYYDPNPFNPDGFMKKDNVINVFYKHNPKKTSCQSDISDLPFLVRIELNKEKMMEKDVTLLDIKSSFCNSWEKKHSMIKGFDKDEKNIVEKISKLSILSNYDNSQQPVIHIRFDMVEFDASIIEGFVEKFIDKFKLKGMPGVTNIVNVKKEPIIRFDKSTGDMIRDNHHVIYTRGINMIDIRYLNSIDVCNTICNDVSVIYRTFGIDAARMAIHNAFVEVFNFTMVNDVHIGLLADFMTNTGILISIDRHGQKKLEVDPLPRASFEKPVDELINAAVFSEADGMNGVSSRIMAGLVIKGGTGLPNLILDTDLLENSEYVEDLDTIETADTVNNLTTSNIIQDVISREMVSGMFIPN